MQKTYKSFLNLSHHDPEVCILWKINSTTDLTCFERPIKVTLGDAEKTKKKKEIDLDLCMDTFRTDEILDGDNKWY